MKIFNKRLDNRQLLKVLAAEQGDIWLDDIEQLGDHSGHPSKMNRP